MINLLLVIFCVVGICFAIYVEKLNRETEVQVKERRRDLKNSWQD